MVLGRYNVKPILFIAGLALVHVSRLLTIAAALRDLTVVSIGVAIPDLFRFPSLIHESGISLEVISHQEVSISFEGYAREIEMLLSSEVFDLILCDWEPVGY